MFVQSTSHTWWGTLFPCSVLPKASSTKHKERLFAVSNNVAGLASHPMLCVSEQASPDQVHVCQLIVGETATQQSADIDCGQIVWGIHGVERLPLVNKQEELTKLKEAPSK